MSELDDALTRLAAAVARLEAAAARPDPADPTRAADAASDSMQAVAETVADRLDAALARLDRLLDREA